MATKIPKTMTDTITLNDGNKMPLFGFGTYLMKAPGEAEKACLEALRLGYRHIDTAAFYKNEKEVGAAVRKSGVARKDIFVTSKLDPHTHGAEGSRTSIEGCLRDLDIGYIDLYLIHSPNGGKILESYDVMLEYHKKGLIRSVGVSNFGVHHLKGLADAGRPTPAVNQIELNIFWRLEHVVKYCQEHGIVVEGYSPMQQSKRKDDPTIIKIAKRVGKSPFQVMIRWSVQKGYVTIPKTSTLSRIAENADVFDWSITDEEMKELGTKEESSCIAVKLMGDDWLP